MMMKLFLGGSICLLLASPVLAAPKVPAGKAAATTAASDDLSGQTDVIGSKEAPAVFNIVPWKDKNSAIPEREVNTSILRETLQPLDREILLREIEMQKRIK